jgi:hypothetical protein
MANRLANSFQLELKDCSTYLYARMSGLELAGNHAVYAVSFESSFFAVHFPFESETLVLVGGTLL